MAKETVWIALIASIIPLIGIIVTQYLIYKRVKVERISEKRIEHFIEGYKDNIIVHNSLSQIEYGYDIAKNINRIQKTLDEHPYNFSYSFLMTWHKIRDKLPNLQSEKGVRILFDNLAGTEKMHLKKYLLEVLNMKPNEIKELTDAIKGTTDVKELQKQLEKHLETNKG